MTLWLQQWLLKWYLVISHYLSVPQCSQAGACVCGRWDFPSHFCLLQRTGMPSVKFHCKTCFFDLSVPFQPHKISLSACDRANKSPATLNPDSLCSNWFPHQGFRNQPCFDVAGWDLWLISDCYDTKGFINKRCDDQLGCLISKYLFSIWINWFYIVLMKSLCQSLGSLGLRRKECCTKKNSGALGWFVPCSFGNCEAGIWKMPQYLLWTEVKYLSADIETSWRYFTDVTFKRREWGLDHGPPWRKCETTTKLKDFWALVV